MTNKRISEKDNFIYLLLSLVFLLFSSAIVAQFKPANGQYIIIATVVATMFTGIWSIRSRPMAFNAGMALALCTLVVLILVRVLDFIQLNAVSMALLLGFFLLTLKYSGEQIVSSGPITRNKLYGSVCVFLLLGLIWCMLYLLLEQFAPRGFSGIDNNSWLYDFPEFVYFSFVTLTTLGFGEIVPLSPLARFLVYMEAIAGTLYIAIFVSSLIGLRFSQTRNT